MREKLKNVHGTLYTVPSNTVIKGGLLTAVCAKHGKFTTTPKQLLKQGVWPCEVCNAAHHNPQDDYRLSNLKGKNGPTKEEREKKAKKKVTLSSLAKGRHL